VLDAAISAYNAIVAEYLPLKTAIADFAAELVASSNPDAAAFQAVLQAAQAVYDNPADQRGANIIAAIESLSAQSVALADYAKIKVSTTAATGSFPLVAGVAATLVIDTLDDEVVSVAATAFSKDIQLVTGILPSIAHDLTAAPVIIGTLGNSTLIDSLVTLGKIDATALQGKWETFMISVIANPFPNVSQALVVAGSDPRGTAFGVFELSRAIGVSPLVYWADVTPEPKTALHIATENTVIGPPSVKYRGMFINDEDWGIKPWASSQMDPDIHDIGPNTYAKVFEFMLRCKANYIWPAMHEVTKAFWYYPQNPIVAKRYGIVLGSSHCEPLLRNNVDEWTNNFAVEYPGVTKGDWNWATNSATITTYWTDRVVAAANQNQDAVYTIGMRGIHDSGMPGYSTNEDKRNGLISVIAAQRNILSTNLGKPASQVPQIFCPYKEALTLYQLGLNLADDVTICWADDNHGHIRQLSNPAEQLRSGGAGVYYHLSYWGDPEDFLWLSSISPSLVSYEMSRAYDLNTRNLWVFNVGDIKPAEMEFQFAMDLAWDVNKWRPDKARYYARQWAKETFGEPFADALADIKAEYYRLAAAGKPEHIHLISYSETEVEQRLAAYDALVAAVNTLASQIPQRLQDAFYELIEYPVKGAAEMNKKIFYAKKSLTLAAQGNSEALTFATQATNAYNTIISLTNKYNTQTAGGKWNGIMSYNPRSRSQFGAPSVATSGSIAATQTEPDPQPSLTVIAAGDYTNIQTAGYNLQRIVGLGNAATALTVYPLNLTTYTQANIASAPFAEYEVPLQAGKNKILVKCLPTFPLYSGMNLRYAVSIAGSTPEFVDIATSAESDAWDTNIIRGYAGKESVYQAANDTTVRVRVYFPDAGLVLNTVEVIRQETDPLTELINNFDFEYEAENTPFNGSAVVRGKPYGWQQTGTVAGNSFGINFKDATNFNATGYCWYNVNQSPYALPADFELYQTITDLPAGTYTVSCRLAVMAGYMTNCRLFANNNVQYYGKATDYVSNLTTGENNTFAGYTGASGMSNPALNEMSVQVTIAEGEPLRLGIRSSNKKSDGTAGTGSDGSNVYGGFKVDYFRIKQGVLKKKRKVFPIGDSTMAEKASGSTERGWGMSLPDFLNTDSVQVFNNGFDGRSTKSFIDEGKWTAVESQLEEGDFVLIQFGHNDEKQEESSLYTNPATTYRTNLSKFVNETRAKGATPVLLTSIVRRSFDSEGQVVSTHGDYPDAVRQISESLNVPLIDMELQTRLLENIAGVVGSREIHQFNPPTEIDNTHLCNFGAYIIARMVAEGIAQLQTSNSDLQGLTLKTNPTALANAGSNTLDLAYRYLSDRIAAANTALAVLTEAVGYSAFQTAIANAQNIVSNRTLTSLEQINDATMALQSAERACHFSQTSPFDATFAVGNPGFEEGVNYLEGINKPLSWKLEQTTAGTRDIGIKTATPAEGIYKYSIWAGQVSAINLYQDIVLQAGEYTLSAALHTSSSGDVSNQHLYVTVDGNTPIASETLNYDAANYWIPLSVSFMVAADSTSVRIGVQSTGSGTAAGHFSIDNAQLQKTGEVQTSIYPTDQSDPIIETQYYNLQGQRISPLLQEEGLRVRIVRKIHQSGKTETKKIIHRSAK
jgi:lysophospholipase L1-like esterase